MCCFGRSGYNTIALHLFFLNDKVNIHKIRKHMNSRWLYNPIFIKENNKFYFILYQNMFKNGFSMRTHLKTKILSKQTDKDSFISLNVSRRLGESLIKSYCGWSWSPLAHLRWVKHCLIAGHHRSHTGFKHSSRVRENVINEVAKNTTQAEKAWFCVSHGSLLMLMQKRACCSLMFSTYWTWATSPPVILFAHSIIK